MSFVGYWIENDEEEFVINYKDIDHCVNGDELFSWQHGMERKNEELSMQIDAFRMYAGERPSDASLQWFRRVCQAKAATNIGLSRLQKRLVQLGLIPNPRDLHVKKLEENLAAMKLRALTAEVALAELEKGKVSA